VPKRLITGGHRWPWRSHRAAILLLTGTLAILYGRAIHTIANVPQIRRSSYAFDLMSPDAWGTTFIVVGLLTAAGSAFCFDRWFYTVAAALFGCWSLFYAIAWLRGNAFGSAWISAAIFTCFTGILIVCSGWEDEYPRGKPIHPPPPGLLDGR
jgi:hypothetical protein